ncbi:MAG: DUF3311 domain-containing protein [Chloroflexota bacterium]
MKSGSEPSGRGWYLLLLIPCVATLWVPFYASADPAIAGIPYFYWYQFLWVPISAILTAVVYFATREPEVISDRQPTQPPIDRTDRP